MLLMSYLVAYSLIMLLFFTNRLTGLSCAHCEKTRQIRKIGEPCGKIVQLGPQIDFIQLHCAEL